VLFQKLVIAQKEGNLEAIKAEIALHIAGFLVYMAKFSPKLSDKGKMVNFG
jgi:hypothetical protein